MIHHLAPVHRRISLHFFHVFTQLLSTWCLLIPLNSPNPVDRYLKEDCLPPSPLTRCHLTPVSHLCRPNQRFLWVLTPARECGSALVPIHWKVFRTWFSHFCEPQCRPLVSTPSLLSHVGDKASHVGSQCTPQSGPIHWPPHQKPGCWSHFHSEEPVWVQATR